MNLLMEGVWYCSIRSMVGKLMVSLWLSRNGFCRRRPRLQVLDEGFDRDTRPSDDWHVSENLRVTMEDVVAFHCCPAKL